MNINKEELKARIRKLIDFYGTPQSFIAKHIGIHSSAISKFLSDNLDLKKETLIDLDKFLTSRGV